MPAPTIDDAIDALRKLPPDRQHELAGYIFHLATDEREPEDIGAKGDATLFHLSSHGINKGSRPLFSGTNKG